MAQETDCNMKLKVTATHTDGKIEVLDLDLKIITHRQLLQIALNFAIDGEAVLVIEKGTE